MLGALGLAGIVSLFSTASSSVVGRAYAVDGDTLRIGDTRIRLVGIDAPELEQTCTRAGEESWPCGRQARSFLADLVGREDVSCLDSGRDRYGRTLARCTIGDQDIAGEVAAAGWAMAEPIYARKQDEAQQAGRGIWAGEFDAPAEWRRDNGEQDASFWDWLRAWFG